MIVRRDGAASLYLQVEEGEDAESGVKEGTRDDGNSDGERVVLREEAAKPGVRIQRQDRQDQSPGHVVQEEQDRRCQQYLPTQPVVSLIMWGKICQVLV